MMADEDPKHLAYLRTQICAVRAEHLRSGAWTGIAPSCHGSVAPHHSTHTRGMGQRSHDHNAMPLCLKHHFEFHAGLGHFKDWNHDRRTEWQRQQVEIYRPKNDPEVF